MTKNNIIVNGKTILQVHDVIKTDVYLLYMYLYIFI